MTPRIAVIDHGAGNLVSIAQGLERAGALPFTASDPQALRSAEGVVLPGVGATASVMEGIRASGFEASLRAWDGPLLGICVGMQVFFDGSDEDDAECFGFIPGRVRPLLDAPLVPHIGWNDVECANDPLFAGLPAAPAFYFVHSYAPRPDDPSVVIGTTRYQAPFAAAVRSGRRVGTQFHPERSGKDGLTVLANFVEECA